MTRTSKRSTTTKTAFGRTLKGANVSWLFRTKHRQHKAQLLQRIKELESELEESEAEAEKIKRKASEDLESMGRELTAAHLRNDRLREALTPVIVELQRLQLSHPSLQERLLGAFREAGMEDGEQIEFRSPAA